MTEKKTATKQGLAVVEAEVVAQPITPMMLISKGMEQGTAIEDMAKLFDLQLRYEDNEAKKAYHKAVSAFKSESITIIKDKHVSFPTSKGKTEYDHARLGQIVKTVVPFLAKHKLSHRWNFDQPEGKVQVTCVLSHELGYSESATLTAAKDESGGKNAIQAMSSSVSYLERYTFLGVTGLAAEDQDDDGSGAEQPKVEVISETQNYDLIAFLKEVGANEQGFCAHFGVSDVALLPVSKYKTACAMLEAKRKGGA